MTLHTGAYSATCVPLVVSFQQQGESVQVTYIHSMINVFGCGDGHRPEMRGRTIASDRSYLHEELVFDKFLERKKNGAV